MEMAAAVMPAAEMVPVTSATMAATMMATAMTAAATTTVAATMTTAVAAFRDREVCDRQRCCEDNRGNSDCDL